MKHSLVAIVFSFTASTLWAQEKLVEPTKNFNLVDAQYVTSFVIKYKNKEQFIKNCFSEWGTPSENVIGTIKWYGINIPQVGNGLTIKLLDGYTTSVKMGGFSGKRFDVFESEDQKHQMLKKMNKGQERLLSITIYDKSGICPEWDENTIMIIKKYLASLFDAY